MTGQVDRLARSAQQVLPALQNAAQRTGVDFSYLFNTARLESAFRPDAKARTSSATGLFQFIDSTWLSTLRKHGPAHGIHATTRAEALNLRTNPAIASLMAAEHAADNAARLKAGLGREPTASDLYLAHFLGSGGAAQFLKGLATNPAMSAATMLPAAAKANKAIFFNGSVPRSLQAVHDILSKRFNMGTTGSAPGKTAGTAGLPASDALERRPLADASTHPQVRMPSEGVDPRRAAQAAYLLLAELGV